MAIDGRVDQKEASQGSLTTAPYLAKIVSHLDPQFQGGVEVTLIRNSGSEVADETQTYVVRYATPFYGATAYEFMGKNDSFDDAQKSYGFWAVPPDVGVTGLVIFIEGNAAQGYWIMCIPDKFTTHMIPAIGGSKNYVPDIDYDQGEHPLPVAEHNRKTNELDKGLEIDKIPRAIHPIAAKLKGQGLIRDEFRGTTTSTSRRDLPNMVFGMSSPGPLDRNGKKSFIGNKQAQALVPVSRLGGTQFVMDDGDDRYFREKPASAGPPKYAKNSGDTTIPYNEHFRIRTRTGHQVVLHNSEDFIYIGNSRGTAWIELSSDGKIDIFSSDSISIRTKQDFNFFADRDFNLEVGRNINIKSGGEIHAHSIKDTVLIVDGDQKVKIKGNYNQTVDLSVMQTVTGSINVRATGSILHTSAGSNETTASSIIETAAKINMNGPQAAQATIAKTPYPLVLHSIPDLKTQSAIEKLELIDTIMRRLPTPEAYSHHENLDPVMFKPEKTDRDIAGRFPSPDAAPKSTTDLSTAPSDWKKYKKPSDNPF